MCSDAMARGMDVEGVEGVVSYQPPARFKTYLHRVGRTARAGQRGVAYTFLAHEEVTVYGSCYWAGLTVQPFTRTPSRYHYHVPKPLG